MSSPLPPQERQEAIESFTNGATLALSATALGLALFPEPITTALGVSLQSLVGGAALGTGTLDFTVRAFPVPGAEGDDVGLSATGFAMGLAGTLTRGRVSTAIGATGLALGLGTTFATPRSEIISIRAQVRQRELQGG